MNPDVVLFHLLNNLAGISPVFDWLVRALVNDYLLPTVFALVLGAVWFTGETEADRRRIQRAVLLVLVSIVVANTIMRVGQVFYFRPRPFATEAVKLLFYRPSVSSFPSVPTATLFVFAAGVWQANRTLGAWLIALGAAFGVARVIAGVHYPLDIVGGALLGIISVWLVFRYARFLDPLVNRILGLAEQLNLA